MVAGVIGVNGVNVQDPAAVESRHSLVFVIIQHRHIVVRFVLVNGHDIKRVMYNRVPRVMQVSGHNSVPVMTRIWLKGNNTRGYHILIFVSHLSFNYDEHFI